MNENKEQVQESKIEKNDALLEEIQEQEISEGYGGAWWNISKNLGNKGRFCTLTKECQSNCN